MKVERFTHLALTLAAVTAFVAGRAIAAEPTLLADNKRGQKEEKHNEHEKAPEKKRADNGIPDTAKVVDEGKDKEFSYKADVDGMAYLWNDTDNKAVQSFRLQAGDRLTISPKSNAMAINQKTVKVDTDLSRHVTYKLLYDVKK